MSISVAVAALLVASLTATPVAAAPGGPALNYLRHTIRPLLHATHAAVVALQEAVGSMPSSIEQLLSTTGEVRDLVTSQPTLNVVKTRLTTYPGETATLNLDVKSLPAGSLVKIKKYSVTLRVLAPGVASGVDRVQVVNGVFDGTSTAYDMTITELDPAATDAVALPPYVGTNSYLRVSRGADGLGPFDVLVNAYIESEP